MITISFWSPTNNNSNISEPNFQSQYFSYPDALPFHVISQSSSGWEAIDASGIDGSQKQLPKRKPPEECVACC